MVIESFPPVTDADEDGLLALGGDLEVESLLLAYQNGIFPWPLNEKILAWFSPPERAVLFLDEFKVSKSLRKELRKGSFQLTTDRCFKEVVNECSAPVNRGKQRGTWITKAMIRAYVELHKLGYAHSIEANVDGKLVGGLYGVSIGSMFAGESMFYRVSDASKVALCGLVDFLSSRGTRWIDCQVMTPLFEQVGARLIQREEFLKLLRSAIDAPPQAWPAAGSSLPLKA